VEPVSPRPLREVCHAWRRLYKQKVEPEYILQQLAKKVGLDSSLVGQTMKKKKSFYFDTKLLQLRCNLSVFQVQNMDEGAHLMALQAAEGPHTRKARNFFNFLRAFCLHEPGSCGSLQELLDEVNKREKR